MLAAWLLYAGSLSPFRGMGIIHRHTILVLNPATQAIPTCVGAIRTTVIYSDLVDRFQHRNVLASLGLALTSSKPP